MPRPIVAKIDTRALAHNLAVAKRLAGHARVWAVIKANAYGHGLLRAAQAFAAADGLAMLDMEEAVQLRRAGETRPLLLLEGFFDSADLMQCAA
jgi:alanine racemase